MIGSNIMTDRALVISKGEEKEGSESLIILD